MNNKLLALAACIMAGVLSVLSAAVRAEDIDIFKPPTDTSSGVPNVLFMIDNSANWTSALDKKLGEACNKWPVDMEWPGTGANLPKADSDSKAGSQLCAMVYVIRKLGKDAAAGKNSGARIGVMLFNSATSTVGAYPRINFTVVNSVASADALIAKIQGITSTSGEDSTNGPVDIGRGMYEAHLWFAGKAPLHGRAMLAISKDAKRVDTSAFTADGSRYISPAADSCAKNYIVYIGNGSPNVTKSTNDNEQDLLKLTTSSAGNLTAIPVPTGISSSDRPLFDTRGDEFARALSDPDTLLGDYGGAQTFTVAVLGASSDFTANITTSPFSSWFAVMNSMGKAGTNTPSDTARYFYPASSPVGIATAIGEILDRILSENNVFASVSLPISVNTQGVFKNQVFIGMFRPDANNRPRWYGNLKQYQFYFDAPTNTLSLVDADKKAAIGTDGSVDIKARSFWTAASTFWQNSPRTSNGSDQTSDSPDGRITEAGATAQRQREQFATSQTGRKVYTCVGCADRPGGSLDLTNSARAFSTSNSSVTALLPNEVIDWTRGTNNVTGTGLPGLEEPRPTTTPATTVRPSIQGDVLHSRPAVVDYFGDGGTIAFYGSNDGTLRAIDANQDATKFPTAGQELWAFVPQEMYSKLARVRDNTPEIKYVTSIEPTATPRDYYVDGPLVVYQKTATKKVSGVDVLYNEKVILYVPMRRGGRALYAFDVTDPARPAYLWRFDTDGYSRLGQTWAEPRLTLLRGYSNPVIVMGAGYDAAAEDAKPVGATTMGDAVLVIDAFDGDLVKALTTTGMRSVPSAVTLVDTDNDRYVDRAYVGDTGSSVYRIDFETPTGTGKDHWTITRIAKFDELPYERKFLYEPDVVVTKDFVAVMIGTGNRERPLLGAFPLADKVDSGDRFFSFYDRVLAKDPSKLGSPLTVASLGSFSYDKTAKTWSGAGTDAGCSYALPWSPTGEKIVNAPITVGGRTLFSTNEPVPAPPEVTDPSAKKVCTPKFGIARTYAVPVFCEKPAFTQLLNGGLPPTPVTGLVDLGDGVIKRFLIGGAPPDASRGYDGSKSSIGTSRPPVAVESKRKRTYWYPNRER